MTIEDGLEELEEKKKKQETPAEKLLTDLEDKARIILGSVLIDYFNGELPGQDSLGTRITGKYEKIIKETGCYLFRLIPGKDSDDDIEIITEFNKGLNEEKLRYIIKTAFGEDALDTDLAGLAVPGSNELFEIVPEFNSMKTDLMSNYVYNRRRTTLHPHLIAMDMHADYGPLATVAIQKGIEEGSIKLLENRLINQPTRSTLANMINEMKLSTKDLVETAKKHGKQDIVVPTLKEYQRACSEYTQGWEN